MFTKARKKVNNYLLKLQRNDGSTYHLYHRYHYYHLPVTGRWYVEKFLQIQPQANESIGGRYGDVTVTFAKHLLPAQRSGEGVEGT